MTDRSAHTDVDRLLTQREAAQFLRVSERYLWTLRHKGELPHLRIGNRIRYRLSDLEGWVHRQVHKI